MGINSSLAMGIVYECLLRNSRMSPLRVMKQNDIKGLLLTVILVNSTHARQSFRPRGRGCTSGN